MSRAGRGRKRARVDQGGIHAVAGRQEAVLLEQLGRGGTVAGIVREATDEALDEGGERGRHPTRATGRP